MNIVRIRWKYAAIAGGYFNFSCNVEKIQLFVDLV